MKNAVWIKQGDRRPALEAELFSGDVALNATGCTVTFAMRPYKQTTAATKKAASFVTSNPAVARYEWDALDTQVAGKHYAEFEVTYPDGKTMTFPGKGYLVVMVEAQTA